jgi:tRNA(Phe) wybutosine-synthesizing methylase Tyw3
MKYKQAMNTKGKKSWVKAMGKEHNRMEKYKVLKAVKKDSSQESQGFVFHMGNEEESKWSLLCQSHSKRI